ncbi:MAG: DUF1559 domain-containing protein [Phycisphaerales bacterium]
MLVSMTVIAVLISILLPSIGGIQESARRVVCQSNVRQIGLGIVMFADDHQGHLPASQFLNESRYGPREAPAPQNMLTLRVASDQRWSVNESEGWDGMGLLYHEDYLSAPKIFFCPSHRGQYKYSEMVRQWNDPEVELTSNYHFRGAGPSRNASPGTAAPQTFNLYNIDPGHSSLIADGMRELSDYNHRNGVSFFRADLTVHWYSDFTGRLSELLPVDKDSANPAEMASAVNEAWRLFDASANADGH